MFWSLALCPDDTQQDSLVYGADFGVVFLAKGPRTASIVVHWGTPPLLGDPTLHRGILPHFCVLIF